ncbi:MAG TPA: DUF2752 domain-containing protein [Nitrospirota bacterium]|nr:DUF2752 domain-containing protein [Nitrospirota bacterium]
MRVIRQKRTQGGIEYGIIYGGIALLAICVGRFVPVLTFAPSCVFKGLTGVPCPTCGATRSVVHLARGELFASFVMNPLVSLCFVIATLVFFYCLITLIMDIPRISFILSDHEKNIVRSGTFALALANWCYLILSR